MDPMEFMGLLGQAQGPVDPQTTGSVKSPQALPTDQLPASAATAFNPDANSGAVEYDGSDPELRAYAKLGIDPDLIRAKRADSIQKMAMILMGQGPGVDGSNLGAQLAAASDSSKDIGEIMKMKSQATKDTLARAHLTLMQQKLAADSAAAQRLAQLGAATQSALGYGPAATGGSDGSGPSLDDLAGNSGPATIAQAAQLNPAPVAQARVPDPETTGGPGGSRLDVSDLPGQGANPRLSVEGSGAGQSVEARNVATIAAASRGDFRPLSALGIPGDVARSIAQLAPVDAVAANKLLIAAQEKSRYASTRNDTGVIISRDQYGNISTNNAPTLQDLYNKKAQENAQQLQFNRANIDNVVEQARREKIAKDGVVSEQFSPGQIMETNVTSGAHKIVGKEDPALKELNDKTIGHKDAAEAAMRSLDNTKEIRGLIDKASMGPGTDLGQYLYMHQPFTVQSMEDRYNAKAALQTKLGELAALRLRVNLPGQKFNRNEFLNSEKNTGGDLAELSPGMLHARMDQFNIEDRRAIEDYQKQRAETLNRYKGTAMYGDTLKAFPDYSSYLEHHDQAAGQKPAQSATPPRRRWTKDGIVNAN